MLKPHYYNRRTLPPELRDLTQWPEVDTEALEPKVLALFMRREKAIRAYLDGHRLKDVWKETRIGRHEVVRLLNRCVSPHEDGRLFGWRGLLPWNRTCGYVRLAGPCPNIGGNAGLFAQFLRDRPEIAGPLDETILTAKQRDALRESRFSHREVYGRFRRLCVEAKIPGTQYPLSNADAGRRAVRRYARNLLLSNFTERAERLGGANARLRSHLDLAIGERFTSQTPFDLVSLDAHRLNFVGCLGVRESGKIRAIPIKRLNIIPVVELRSTAVLGYAVSIGAEPSAQDIVQAVKSALTPWKPRQLVVEGHRYPEAAKMPSAAIPETAGLCWNALLIDNASVHCANAVSEGLRKRLGCAINFGPVRQWYRRPLVESLFSALERSGFTRLPNSVGYGPADPLKGDGVASAVKYEMMLEEMLDLIDIVICTYNATPRESLGHLSPLQALADAMLCAGTQWLPRLLPELSQGAPELGTQALTVRVRGNREKGRRPYIQYRGVHYASPILSGAHDLIGEPIQVHVRPDDLRTLKAFHTNGEEIGILTATGGWSRTAHDAKLRKEVLDAVESNALVVGPDTDPIQELLVLKRWQLLKKEREKTGAPKISKEATDLARMLKVAGKTLDAGAMPTVAASNSHHGSTQSTGDTLPSFVRRLKHRGVKK
jgi:hypothetical protein